jgi:hypothetical protein
MRVLAMLCLFASPAAAQPGVCNVTIVRAPEAVRDIVEGWVGAEPRCSGTLEVRILPTDGGYYLFARDAAGRIRERVVPDPQSAGVLIASWAADDAPPEAPPSFVPAAPMQDSFVDTAPHTPGFLSWGGWATLGYVTSGDTHGLRAELDVVGRGPIALGVSLSRTAFELQFQGKAVSNNFPVFPGHVTGLDTRATVYLVDTFHQGPLSVRLALGGGAIHTQSIVDESYMFYEASGWSPIGELSLELGLELGRWSLTAGVVGTMIKQKWFIGGTSEEFPGFATRDEDVVGMLGVRCHL